jgi:Homeodomain-like domain
LREKLPSRLRLSNPERATLAEIGKRLGRKVLREVACVARPDTILAWYRRLVAQKFDGSKHRQYPGRPPVSGEVEALVIRMARENSGWGYDRIVGTLANLGHHVSDQTVGNILRRHGIAPAPKRSQITTWKDFLAAHMNVLAGCDFFTVEVLEGWRLTTCCSSFIWKAAGCAWPESPDIQIKNGWSRLLVARRRRHGAIFIHVAMFCTIATRSSVPRFGRRWQAAAGRRFNCQPKAQT